MLKEVGASGQISLGKKYAGQLFDVQTAPDGTITLMPVKVVPATLAAQEEPARYAAAAHEWSSQHATEIDEYNAWAEQREPYSQRVRRWRAEQQK
ncbi:MULTISPECIES: hypothetical protein [unclassified Acidovorax]|uniref:hypothetical protein n=1 Tax=unclassified Acidovorax TaxID=2684926 RepID=UPI000B400F2A|nr:MULTISPECIES: hypothetical protein [unclassified Acidovorax]